MIKPVFWTSLWNVQNTGDDLYLSGSKSSCTRMITCGVNNRSSSLFILIHLVNMRMAQRGVMFGLYIQANSFFL